MTLENLAKIGSIKAHEPSQSELSRLLHAASHDVEFVLAVRMGADLIVSECLI
jgi:hypothetical protein